jgi:SAM-dependent methyltransferase
VDGAQEVLDAGCGTGHNLDVLRPFGAVSGVDLNRDAVALASARGVNAQCASITRLPFQDRRFGLVACLDVLEHVDDDEAALRELRRVTARKGALILTVPAYPSLVSEHDRAAGHVRRYSPPGLRRLLRTTGWREVLTTHFNSLLLPVAAAHRRLRRTRSSNPRSDLLRGPPAFDSILVWPLRLEARLIQLGARLPAGLSLLVVLRNP